MSDYSQFFAQFRGLDSSSSDLNRDPDAAKEMSNIEIDRNYALLGRLGFSPALEQSGVQLRASHRYIYKSPVNNETKEEIIFLGDTFYRLKEDSLGNTASFGEDWVIQSNYTDGKYRLRVRDMQDSGSSWIEESATVWTVSSLSTAIANLNAAIGGAVTFSIPATLNNASFISLGQFPELEVGSSVSISIPVYYLEEIPMAPMILTEPFDFCITLGVSCSVNGGLGLDNSVKPINAYSLQDTRNLIVQSATFLNHNDCCYITTGGALPLLKYDGVMIQESGCFPFAKEVVDVSYSAGSLTGDYRYYLRWKNIDAQGNIIYGAGDIVDASASSETININSKTVTTLGYGDMYTYSYPTFIEDYSLSLGYEKLSKGDFYPFGFFDGYPVDYVDYENNLVHFESGSPTEYNPFGLNSAQEAPRKRLNYFFKEDTLIITTTDTAPTANWTITNAFSGELQVGSKFFIRQNSPDFVSPDNVDFVTIIAVDGSDIILDVYLDEAETFYLTPYVLEVYRTEAGGVEKFYKLTEKLSANVSIADNKADANLGAEFFIPENEPHNLKFFPSVVAEHQGVMVVGGFQRYPNRIFFEDIIHKEAFPLTTNFIDVNFQEQGIIKALLSVDQDALGVFKDRSYYIIRGDINAEFPFLTQQKVTEGDYGVTSQNSLVKIKDINIGVGLNNFIIFLNGSLSLELTKRVEAEFKDREEVTVYRKIDYKRIQSINDEENQKIIFYLPYIKYGEDIYSEDDGLYYPTFETGKIITFDYSEDAWGRINFNPTIKDSCVPNAGMFIYKNKLHFTNYDNTYTRILRRNILEERLFHLSNEVLLGWDEITQEEYDNTQEKSRTYAYHDAGIPIPYEYTGQWAYIQSPSIEKVFTWLKLYSLPVDEKDFIPFSLTVDFYKNWNATSAYDSQTVSFDTFSDTERLIKLVNTKARCLLFKMTTNTVFTRPLITGYEVITEPAYDGETPR